jgi:hypothetical protein
MAAPQHRGAQTSWTAPSGRLPTGAFSAEMDAGSALENATN